jgi:hypothetical protein
MPTPNRYHDRHVLDTCTGCWRQRCDCQQAEQTRAVVFTLTATAALVVAVLSTCALLGWIGG